MSNLAERVSETIHQRELLRRTQIFLIAVSGGVDSMVLLHLLHGLSRKNSWRLNVAHLNHGLRGRSANADEKLVVRTARKLNLPIVVEHADVKQFARDQKLSIEMAARKVRHEFLARTAARLKIRTIALAHHADDQVELFFLRLLRGSGNEGLAGMKWKNPSPADSRIELVRPLLNQTKAEIKKFAAQNKIPFREDATNSSLDIRRNWIRRELLPLLRRDYEPALERTILRAMEIAAGEAEVVGSLAADWLAGKNWRGGRVAFSKLPVAVQRRCLQQQLLRQKIAPDFELVENLRLRPKHFIKVSGNFAVNRETDGCLRFEAARRAVASNSSVRDLKLSRTGQAVFGSVNFNWQITSRRTRDLPKARAGRESFDAEKVGARITLRHWRAGDRFQPSGLKSPVKLQDLFVNGKIPRDERGRLIVAAAANGEIFWVERLRIAERFKLAVSTKHCLQWHWKRC